MTTRFYFTKKARTDIWAEGLSVTKTHVNGKHAGSEYQGRDKSKPSGPKDRLIVKKGESYYWWKFAFGPKIISKTQPTRSQLTQSSFLSALYDLEDRVSNEVVTYDPKVDDYTSTLESIRDNLIGEIESLRDGCQDSLDNMPEHLQESSTSGQTLQERIDGLESWISELEDIDCNVDVPGLTDEATAESDVENAIESKIQDRIEEILSEIQNTSSGL